MGHYSSDSEEEKKKRKKKKKKRSRSRSESIESRHSSKPKKSKKKKKRKSRSRSRSSERYRRSRSRSYSRRSRSRSYDSKDRYKRRSRSDSRSRSRSRDRRRRRSRSHDSYSRSSRRSRSYSSERRSRKNRSSEREDPCANIPGFAEMTPAEQAKIRMHMALKAAAAADEKLKGEVSRSHSSASLHDSLTFAQAVQDIEASGFSAATFKSNRGDKKDEKPGKDEFTFGTAGELRLDSQKKPVLVDVEKEDLAHPSLYTDPEEKMDRWIQRLAALRRKKLEGEALT